MKSITHETKQFTLGRSDGCDYKILHPSVSRLHLKVFYTDDEVLIDDLNSKLGTYVILDGESKRIKSAKIKRNTLIRIGDSLDPVSIESLIQKYEIQKIKEARNIKNKIKSIGSRRCHDCGSVISKKKIHCHICGAILEECA